MYDTLILGEETLPAGVGLATILEGCEEEAIMGVLPSQVFSTSFSNSQRLQTISNLGRYHDPEKMLLNFFITPKDSYVWSPQLDLVYECVGGVWALGVRKDVIFGNVHRVILCRVAELVHMFQFGQKHKLKCKDRQQM